MTLHCCIGGLQCGETDWLQMYGVLLSIDLNHLLCAWQMEPSFRETVASFHLNPPTNEYVPPYKDPWRFW
jgi:hypothetical protein